MWWRSVSQCHIDHTAVLILALDTTTRAGSVAVTRDDDVLALVGGDPSRTHGERLPAEIERALAEAGVGARDLHLLVVARGPGAFTGLRIGLAAMQGLAMVLGIPVVGVSALDALAFATWSRADASTMPTLVAWMDAQRGEVFGAQYDASGFVDFPWRHVSEPVVGPPAELLESLSDMARQGTVFVGDGALRYQSIIDAWSGGACRVIAPPPALAGTVAHIGRRLADRGAAGPPHALQPLYVRRPDAELERLRRHHR